MVTLLIRLAVTPMESNMKMIMLRTIPMKKMKVTMT